MALIDPGDPEEFPCQARKLLARNDRPIYPSYGTRLVHLDVRFPAIQSHHEVLAYVLRSVVKFEDCATLAVLMDAR